MKKAFTIIELLVAMGLLSMLIAISGLVFSTAIKAHRAANATAEISAKLQALTHQLDADFQGLRKEMPVAFWFEHGADGRRYDQIQFFADGAFQTSKQWEYKTKDTDGVTDKLVTDILAGNTARIYYGHANNVTINTTAKTRTAYRKYNAAISDVHARTRETILARRAHLQTGLNTTLVFPDVTSSGTFVGTFIPWTDGGINSKYYGNDCFEYDDISLPDWTNILTNSTTNANQYLNTCFGDTTGRPGIDLTASDGESLHMIMAQGVGSFCIQMAYAPKDLRLRADTDNGTSRPTFVEGAIRWWPSLDANGDANTSDSDFGTAGMNAASFGCYMQFPSTPTQTGWSGTSGCLTGTTWRFTSDYFPRALKFTFTLYDSNGVFPKGKTFTYIVHIN